MGVISVTPVNGVDSIFIKYQAAFADHRLEISAVTAFHEWCCQCEYLIGRDVPESVSDLFQAGDFQALSFLNDADEIARVEQR